MVFKTALMIKPTKKITKQKTLDLSFRIYSDAIINNKEIDVLVFLMLCLETLGQECIYLYIYIYIYIFSDLLNQKFLLQIDCKSAKYIIEKDVENIASKHIFARWQAITIFPRNPNASQYVKKRYVQNLFSVEPNRASITNPFRLATSYFPPLFHWIHEYGQKNVQYYSAILQHENSITIKPIREKANGEKIIYHSVYLKHIISEEKWGSNPTTTRTLPNFPVPYFYHDYIIAWFRFMLHQNETMSHSWFVNFHKDVDSVFPL